MAESLTSFIESLGPSGDFTAGPIFQPEADLLTVFFEDGDHYAERIDRFLTVFLSFSSGKLLGFELKGIRHKAQELAKTLRLGEKGCVRVGVKCEPHVNLLLTFYMKEPLGNTRRAYQNVYEKAGEMSDLTLPAELVA